MGLENYRRSVSEAKRTAILSAGRSIFLRDGFSRAAVADIARDADVSTATLYKHFTSKEELFAAVVRDTVMNVADFSELIAADSTLAEIFLRLGRSYLHVQFDLKMNDLMRIVIAEATANPALAQDVTKFMGERRRTRLMAILDTLVERRMLRPHDTHLGALLLAGMIKELFVWPALFDTNYVLPPDTDDKIGAVADIYIARYGA